MLSRKIILKVVKERNRLIIGDSWLGTVSVLFKPQKVRKVGSGLQEATRGGELRPALDCRGLEQSVAVPRDLLSHHKRRCSRSPLATVFRSCRLWGQQAVVVHLVALCCSSSPGLAAEPWR